MNLITPDFGLFFWQTITFAIVLFILGKFAWGPIMSSLKEREDSITEALEAAQQAKAEMASLKAANEALLQEARLQRDKMLRDAQTVANNLLNEAKDKATKEGALLLENARRGIESEKNAALAEVKNYAVNIALEVAEKILKRELKDNDAQKALVSEYLKESTLN
ncbi:MAG: atpF [Chitinophagaceae bacterium]|nr:atpF [Chitinophagaceae bacterium]